MVDKVKSRKDLLKVIENINTDFQLSGVTTDMHIELVTDERAGEMIDFLAQNFYQDEVISRMLGIVVDDYVRELLLYRFRDNYSLLLVSNNSNKIIGCQTINVIEAKQEFLRLDSIKNENVRNSTTFLRHKNEEMDVFKYFEVDTAVSLVQLAIHKDFRNKGIASLMFKAVLKFAKEIGLEPACVSVEGTSKSSQKILEKFGFEVLHSVKYADYKVNGEVVFKNIGENESCKFCVKKL